MQTLFFLTVSACLVLPSSAAPAAAEGTSTPKVSAEMRAFMKRLDGNDKHVNAALKEYAAEGVDTSDMFGILVREPKVTKAEVKDGLTCYTMSCKTGILDRVYLVSWKDKKIRKLKQLSVK